MKAHGGFLRSEFLRLPFVENDFLINREDVVASVNLEELLPTKIGVGYLSWSIKYSGRRFLLFDLDLFLSDLFGARSGAGAMLALLIKIPEPIKSIIAEKITEISRNDSGAIPPGTYMGSYLAVRVGCDIAKISIAHNELKLMPTLLRSSSVDTNGLLLIRFMEERIQYLIDLKKVLSCLPEFAVERVVT